MSESTYYDRYWTPEGFNPDTRPFDALMELLEAQVTPSAECLDVGCGNGGTAGAWLAEHTARYVGVDISATAVEAARARGLDARRIEDATKLPFDDESFDLVTCTEVLEHLFEPQVAVAEMRRVLRPGGRLFLTVPNVGHWRNRLDLAVFGRFNARGDDLSAAEPWRDPHIRFFTMRSLRRMLEAQGLEVERIGGHSEAGQLAVIPGLRRLTRGDAAPGPLSRRLDALAPAVASLRLNAVAVRPPRA